MGTQPEVLILRADASIQIGSGHVMRCLALAQAWRDAGGHAIFAMAEATPAVEERLRNEGFEVTRPGVRVGSAADADGTAQLARKHGASWVVVDGYEFGAEYQASLKGRGLKVLFIDDNGHARHYSADLVLNQNAHAREDFYPSRDASTRLLLGPRFAMLRREFTSWRGWKRTTPDRARKILLTIGGSDPDNASEQILQSLAFLDRKNKDKDLEVVLVVGGGNPHLESLQAASERCPVPVRIARSVQDMPALMAWADVAIAGAGVTSYELCFMALPSLLLIVAENQRRIAERLSQFGVAVNAGTSREFRGESFAGQLQALVESSERREAMSHEARGLVDGSGSERVRAALLERELKLRLVRESDCRLLFEWADDPVARAASFHPAAISWEGHTRWFAERLQDSQSVIYIGENSAGDPVGVVRFQIEGEMAVLSVNVAPEFRGQGWGRELIAFSTRSLVRAFPVRRVDAFVKLDNQASVRLFETSGFQRTGRERVADQDALLFTWECGNGTHVN